MLTTSAFFSFCFDQVFRFFQSVIGVVTTQPEENKDNKEKSVSVFTNSVHRSYSMVECIVIWDLCFLRSKDGTVVVGTFTKHQLRVVKRTSWVVPLVAADGIAS